MEGSRNSFFGNNAGISNATGFDNSFFGTYAGTLNKASDNTFFGSQAGFLNEGGTNNAFFGRKAGMTNVGGGNNTIIGANADVGTNNLTNATTIGANASVTQSNSLVLGSINGINGATADTKVGIGTTAPTSKLTVAGLIETTTGGVKFPDSTIQTTAAAGGITGVTTGAGLTGGGTSGNVTLSIADSGVTAAKIASGQVVRNLNGLTDNVTLAAGANVTITPTGNTLTIAATGGSGSSLAVKEEDGSPTVANVTELRVSNGTLTNNGGGSVSITTGGGSASCGSLCTADIFDATTQYNIGGNRMLSAPGGRNLFIGHLAGGIPADPSATNNTFVGPSAGSSNETGSGNTYIGTYTGSSSKNGVQNVYIGYSAGGTFTDGGGIANVFVGTGAGQRTNLGGSNTFLGSGAGGTQITGNSNTALGAGATPGTSNLSFATAVGAGAVVNSSNTVVLGRSADTVIVPGTFSNPSDARLKTGITNLHYGLSEVMRLRPVTWTWKDRPGGKTGLGLIAQDVKPVLPELVEQGTDKDHMLSMNYIGLLPIVIKAIQEQQANVTGLSNEIAALRMSNTNSVNKAAVFTLVESSGRTNICNGNVTTDAKGEATVALPDDFEAQTQDFRYRLTVIGQFAQAIVSTEIRNDHFTIKTDKSNVKVSWQVTGIRKAKGLDARPAAVTQEKTLDKPAFELAQPLPTPISSNLEATEQSKQNSPRVGPVPQRPTRQIEP